MEYTYDQISVLALSRKLKISKTMIRLMKNARYTDNFSYYDFVIAVHGWQVIRTFRVFVKQTKRNGTEVLGYEELMQNWIKFKDGEFKRVVLCRPMIPSYVGDGFSYQSPMRIVRRIIPRPYSYRNESYIHRADHVKTISVTKELRDRGFDGRYHGFSATGLFMALLTNPHAVTLMKLHRMDLATSILDAKYYSVYDGCSLNDYWTQIRMCIRQNYYPSNLKIWIDTIDMSKKLGIDVNNSKNVILPNLKETHDRLVNRIHREEELRRINGINSTKISPSTELQYKKMRGMFFGIVIKSKHAIIEPLRSVDEFKKEAIAMHHCVFASEYYNHKDSLILSAKDLEGNRIATVEYNLNDKLVEQCRGAYNKWPEYHDEIYNAVMSFMKRFVPKVN